MQARPLVFENYVLGTRLTLNMNSYTYILVNWDSLGIAHVVPVLFDYANDVANFEYSRWFGQYGFTTGCMQQTCKVLYFFFMMMLVCLSMLPVPIKSEHTCVCEDQAVQLE